MDKRGHFVVACFLLCVLFLLGACVSKQTGVREVGSFDTGTAYAVIVQGVTALVANNDGVVLIDIHERDHPRKLAEIELSEAAFGVDVENDLVYIAAPSDGLVIADVRDKAAPRVVGTYAVSGINEICVSDLIAYAATQDGDLYILSVADPAQPVLLSTYTGGSGLGLMVACFQDVVYFSTSSSGLSVLDVSDPSAPIKTMTVASTQGAKDAQIVGELLYLACHGNGWRILDIADPLFPKMIASLNDGGEAWGVGGNADVLWIGDLQDGIKIYDVSSPESPVRIARDPGYAPHDLFFDGQYAFLADQDRGFVILSYNDRQ